MRNRRRGELLGRRRCWRVFWQGVLHASFERDIPVLKDPGASVLRDPFAQEKDRDEGQHDDRRDDLAGEYVGGDGFVAWVCEQGGCRGQFCISGRRCVVGSRRVRDGYAIRVRVRWGSFKGTYPPCTGEERHVSVRSEL